MCVFGWIRWRMVRISHLARLTDFISTCMFRSCVSSGGAPTPAGTSMFTMWKICTHMKCELKHNGDMKMGHLWLIMDIYHLKLWVKHLWLGLRIMDRHALWNFFARPLWLPVTAEVLVAIWSPTTKKMATRLSCSSSWTLLICSAQARPTMPCVL